MKYVVELEKVIKRTVIIDADSDEEADRKMKAEDIEKEYQRVEGNHVYGDWNYKDGSCYTVESDDDLITCADDIARLYGCDDASGLERALFKYTDCGMCATWDENKITLVGYVEGCDAEHPEETLFFPFTVNEFRKTRGNLEVLADELWHMWNDDDEV